MNALPSTVLVTGALGWLGSRLVESLAAGLPDHDALKMPRADLRIRCRVLPGQDATGLKKFSSRVEILVGDVQKPADCAQFCKDAPGAVLFHTAGIIHPKQIAEFYQVNIQGTVNVIE